MPSYRKAGGSIGPCGRSSRPESEAIRTVAGFFADLALHRA